MDTVIIGGSRIFFYIYLIYFFIECRNEIVLSTAKHRVAIGVQVNKRIEHMERVDHRHVMW